MIINLQNVNQMALSMEKMLRKAKQPRDWILYVNTEHDAIPAAMLSSRFPGSLVCAASPLVISNLSQEILSKSILFSVVADQNMFDVWDAVLGLKSVSIATVAFFKLVDDPKYWLEIAIREEVIFKW